MPSVGDKRSNFRRLAEKRTNVLLEDIRKIKNLSNRGNYTYNSEQVSKIFTRIREALDEAEAQFSSSTSNDRKPFEL